MGSPRVPACWSRWSYCPLQPQLVPGQKRCAGVAHDEGVSPPESAASDGPAAEQWLHAAPSKGMYGPLRLG